MNVGQRCIGVPCYRAAPVPDVGPRCIGVPCYRAAPVPEHKSLPQGYDALPVSESRHYVFIDGFGAGASPPRERTL